MSVIDLIPKCISNQSGYDCNMTLYCNTKMNLTYFEYEDNTYIIDDYDMNEDSKEYEALCNTAYQSTSCKVGFIAFSGNHFEPIIQAAFTSDKHLDEGSSTFLFEWTNPILCKIKNAANRCKDNAVYGETYSAWKEPGCPATGGRRHRRSARARSARARSARYPKRRRGTGKAKRRLTRRRRAY